MMDLVTLFMTAKKMRKVFLGVVSLPRNWKIRTQRQIIRDEGEILENIEEGKQLMKKIKMSKKEGA